MENKIHPCRFCGHYPQYYSLSHIVNMRMDKIVGYAACSYCNYLVTTDGIFVNHAQQNNGKEESIEKVLAIWNRRNESFNPFIENKLNVETRP